MPFLHSERPQRHQWPHPAGVIGTLGRGTIPNFIVVKCFGGCFFVCIIFV